MTQSPENQHEEDISPSNREEASLEAQGTSRSAQKGPRKRTKTGCLTCRRRRIKCGEEKPICSNCTKSKRFCEGYNPRISFRVPPPVLGATEGAFNVRPPLPSHCASFEGYPSALPRLDSGIPHSSLRPIRPTPLPIHQQDYHAAGDTFYVTSGGFITPGLTEGTFVADPVPPPFSADALGTFQPRPHNSFGDSARTVPHGELQRHASISGPDPGQSWTGGFTPQQAQRGHLLARSNTLTSYSPITGASTAPLPARAFPPVTLPSGLPASQFSSPTDDSASLTSTQIAAYGGQPLPSDHPFYPEVTAYIDPNRFEMTSNEHDPRRYSAQGFVQRPSFNLSIPTPIESPPSISASQINYDEEDEDEDDPWDVEMEIEEGSLHPSEQSKNELKNMLIMHASHDERRGTRSFTTFLNHKNVLAHYRPSHSALPQADEKAARIFCHFVSSTGPSMSIYERAPSHQAGTSGIAAVSGFQQPLWTYTLPTLALHHPPLMHAILALSALHISKLQQTSPGPSIKHFTYALRRVGRLIGLPKRRNEITTLAANLLLGFYEVMSAETSKWNIHLTGARVLAMEIDFAGKTRKIRALRAQAKSGLAQLNLEQHSDYIRRSGIPESLFPDRDWEVDEDLISTFTGYQVRYDYQYQTNTSEQTHQSLEFTARDVEFYKMQADLYWWYCKQDIFQSMLSGNRLLMRYDHWVFCPPRGQMGHLDLIYATMDHLCLIMGRLADFGGKDQSRKRRAMASQSSPTSQPGTSADVPPGPPPPPGKGPPIGYMPAPENPAPLHSAFATMTANLNDSGFPQRKPSVATTAEDYDLETETAAALVEHSAIAQAFDLFASSLPAEYDPLPPDAAPPISTPFGPALQYRTHTISCIWAFYYSGRILHSRLHPSMPPAAMISSQAVSAKTAPFAQKIGKICAGLYYPQQYNLQTGSLNPSLGGALIESTLFLFFAAVQFTDHAQRGWTINKLKEIARLSGWQTAAAVAAGCEFAWQAMGRAGRGPPYKPTMDWRNKDDRVGDKQLKTEAKQQQQHKGKEKERQKDAEEREEGGGGWGQGEDDDEERRQREREEQYFVAAGKDGPSRRRRKKSKQASSEHGDAVRGQEEDDEEEEEEDEEDAEPEAITHDRKTIGTNPYARTHWALGLLSLDEDIAKLDMGKK